MSFDSSPSVTKSSSISLSSNDDSEKDVSTSTQDSTTYDITQSILRDNKSFSERLDKEFGQEKWFVVKRDGVEEIQAYINGVGHFFPIDATDQDFANAAIKLQETIAKIVRFNIYGK